MFGAPQPGQRPELVKTPNYDKLSVYYNLDNGTGKIRGVYLQGNENIKPLFASWLTPFGDLGAKTLTLQNTGGTVLATVIVRKLKADRMYASQIGRRLALSTEDEATRESLRAERGGQPGAFTGRACPDAGYLSAVAGVAADQRVAHVHAHLPVALQQWQWRVPDSGLPALRAN